MTKFYTLAVVSNFIDNERIKSFHYDMFHGLAEREGKESPHDPVVWADVESASPLIISRTIHRIPPICQPSNHLVVSEAVANQLKTFHSLRIAPVLFKRLVDVDYVKEDMDWGERWGWGDPCDLLRTLPDNPEFHGRIGRYFEIRTWAWKDVIDNYPSAKEITIVERTPPMEEESVIRLCPQMLQDYPILAYGVKLLSEQAFAVLDPNLDRDFFLVREYEI